MDAQALSISRASLLRPPESRDERKKGFGLLPSDWTSRILSAVGSRSASAEACATSGSRSFVAEAVVERLAAGQRHAGADEGQGDPEVSTVHRNTHLARTEHDVSDPGQGCRSSGERGCDVKATADGTRGDLARSPGAPSSPVSASGAGVAPPAEQQGAPGRGTATGRRATKIGAKPPVASLTIAGEREEARGEQVAEAAEDADDQPGVPRGDLLGEREVVGHERRRPHRHERRAGRSPRCRSGPGRPRRRW